MDEQAVLRLARRRRLGRRLGLAAVPVALVVWFAAASWSDGVPDAVSLVLLVVLGGGVAVGWWWLERSAGGSVAELRRTRAGRDRFTPEELDDARAELALRTCSPPPPGGRIRVEGLVDRWSRDARFGLITALVYVVVGVIWCARADTDYTALALGILWLLLAVVQLLRSLRWRRTSRRWVAAHGSAPEVAGRR